VSAVPVLFVSSHARLGGSERYLSTLIAGLGAPWIGGVIALEDGPLVNELRAAGVPTEVLPTTPAPPGILRSAWRLRRTLSRRKAAVVHANGVKAALVATLAALGSRVPVIWVKHDFSFDGRLARLIAARSEEVIGVSAAVTATFPSRMKGKIRGVHNGIGEVAVDRSAGRRRLHELLGPPAPAAVVALVGRLEPVKGHRDLLGIARQVADAVPGVRIVFIGGESAPYPDYPTELRAEIERLAQEDVVDFLGHRDDALELIAGADLVAVPTIGEHGNGEGFGYVALEAMAAGTPVVGYAHGGLPELTGDCALLVPPGDRGALAGVIVELLQDRRALERLARCGRDRVASEFSLVRVVEAMKERYLAVAGAS
jgi:glycosyltransferase involved in cell wall biosynthesis